MMSFSNNLITFKKVKLGRYQDKRIDRRVKHEKRLFYGLIPWTRQISTASEQVTQKRDVYASQSLSLRSLRFGCRLGKRLDRLTNCAPAPGRGAKDSKPRRRGKMYEAVEKMGSVVENLAWCYRSCRPDRLRRTLLRRVRRSGLFRRV